MDVAPTHATYAAALLGEKAMTKLVVDEESASACSTRLRSRAKISGSRRLAGDDPAPHAACSRRRDNRMFAGSSQVA